MNKTAPGGQRFFTLMESQCVIVTHNNTLCIFMCVTITHICIYPRRVAASQTGGLGRHKRVGQGSARQGRATERGRMATLDGCSCTYSGLSCNV